MTFARQRAKQRFKETAYRRDERKKHSAAQLTTTKDGKPCITGFYHRFETFFKFVAVPNNANGGRGKNPEYDLWTAKISYGNGIEKVVHATYSVATKALIMGSLGLVAHTKKNFVGVFKSKKR